MYILLLRRFTDQTNSNEIVIISLITIQETSKKRKQKNESYRSDQWFLNETATDKEINDSSSITLKEINETEPERFFILKNPIMGYLLLMKRIDN